MQSRKRHVSPLTQRPHSAEASEEQGGQGQNHAVNHTIRQKTGDHMGAAFDHEFVNPPVCKMAEHVREFNVALCVDGQTKHPGSCHFQGALTTFLNIRPGHDPGRFWMFPKQIGVQGETELTVQNHGLRVLPRSQSHGELRIVSKDGPDTDEYGIMSGSEPVGQHKGSSSAQRRSVTRPGSDTPVQTLCIGQRDPGPTLFSGGCRYVCK